MAAESTQNVTLILMRIMQLFNVIELLLFTINEYRELSGNVIRIDLT